MLITTESGCKEKDGAMVSKNGQMGKYKYSHLKLVLSMWVIGQIIN